MLHYTSFEATVREVAPKDYGQWRHLLPAIPVAHRIRFMHTLKKGFALTDTYDMVMMSFRLADADYDLFLQQALATKMMSANSQGRLFEQVSINR